MLSLTRAHITTINQHNSVSHSFSVHNWSEMCGVVDVLTVLLFSPTGKFRSYRYSGRDGSNVIARTRHIIYRYIYDALDNRYGFSVSVQPGIDCTTSQFLFMKCLKKNVFFLIFKSWQVCNWLAKWITMLRFMDLRWSRVFRRSNVGLVYIYIYTHMSV